MCRLQFSVLALLSLAAGTSAAVAASPVCVAPEVRLGWPAAEPIWELCWLGPNQSVGPRGSGMELRNVHWKGRFVLRRAHAPMLFAEYRGGAGGNCYRDWKDTRATILAATGVQNRLGQIPAGGEAAKTSCDRSTHPTQAHDMCPFGLPVPPGYSCALGVMIEDMGDHVLLTTQYIADWYMYTSRIALHADGRIVPTFGFGNRNGTFSEVTHWHHNYWRFEFDIDGLGNNTVSSNGIDRAVEFSDLREATGGIGGGPKTWEVRNAASGNGFRLVPGANDYLVPANQSGRGFHLTDFMATRVNINEYGDTPSDDLLDCTMHVAHLVNGQAIANTNQALYYRVAVRDTTAHDWPPDCQGAACQAQDSMICKSAGPQWVPFGPWTSADSVFADGFDGLVPGAPVHG